MNTNFHAAHNFSAPAQNVNELRAGLSGGSFGKGSTAEQAEASALMEAIERYSGIFQGDEIRVTRRFTDFPPGDAIAPNDILLFSDAQFRDETAAPDAIRTIGTRSPVAFDPSAKIEWSPVWSLRDERFKYLPTSLLYFFYGGPAAFRADSNGCAAGNTLEEAIVQGFLELVERDAYAIWWYNRLQRPEVDLSQFDDSYVRDLHSQLAEAGRRLWVLDVTSDLGVPTYVAILHWMQNGQENIEFGSGAHFDTRIALLRTLTELNQFLSIGLMGGGTGEKSSLDGITPLRLQDHPFLTPSKQADDPAGLRRRSSASRHTREQVTRLRRYRQARGPRFPRPQSDAARHRGPGRQSDRSGTAAFLSPLSRRPALRCSGQARIARPAAAGKRAQSVSPPYLRVMPACALPQKRRATGAPTQHFRPAQRSRHARSAGRRKSRRLLRWLFGRLGKIQRGCGGSRAGPAHRPAARLVRVRRPQDRQGDRSAGPATGPARSAGVPPRARARATRTRLSSNRRLPIIGRERRSSAMPTLSSCRGSPICGGAATRWSWNRRAPAPCSGFAIRRLRPPSPCCPRRSRSRQLRGRTVFRGSNFSLCWSIAKSFSRSTPPATMASGRPRATTISFFGTSTIFCSTPAAPQAATPTRWAGSIRMRA